MAGTTAEGQNLLANISTSRASLLQGQHLMQENYQLYNLNLDDVKWQLMFLNKLMFFSFIC